MSNSAPIDGLPAEILIAVFNCLIDDRRSLRKAICVCQTWAEMGTNILWRKPPMRALEKLPPQRKQYYANKIKEVSTYSSHRATEDELLFPQLQRFTLCSVPRGHSIKQYIQPCLKELTILDKDSPADLLKVIPSQSSDLRCLRLCSGSLDAWAPDEVAEMLKQLKQLNIIEDKVGKLTGDAALLHLAQKPNLRHLILWHRVAHNTVLQVANLSTATFPALTALKIKLDIDSVPLLPRIACDLQVLILDGGDTGRGTHRPQVFQAIGSLTRLQELVFAMESVKIMPNDLNHLKRLGLLKRLEFKSVHDKSDVLSLTDEQFASLFSCLSGLTSFTLDMQHQASTEIFKELGRHCSKLATFQISGNLDLALLKDEKPAIFPNLKALRLAAQMVEGAPEGYRSYVPIVQRWLDIILRHTPVLEQLDFYNSNGDTQRLKRAFCNYHEKARMLRC
ncbi:hypothetical protein K470DRAFT_264671 [Piedraia hortae CBS 480.64]|uniref:F-box domain-containing protein n=1 Tax=Piedraia hortae CBS 480.64 TaxID=1314780 RepID=A0A6A7BXV2_9PEZI|nr:hypothetical protein K470DRAFT_264671 [Piedraia hortae CBS 480.64]